MSNINISCLPCSITLFSLLLFVIFWYQFFIKLVSELIAYHFLVLIVISLWFTNNFNVFFLCIYLWGPDFWLLTLHFSDERNFEEFIYLQRNQRQSPKFSEIFTTHSKLKTFYLSIIISIGTGMDHTLQV